MFVGSFDGALYTRLSCFVNLTWMVEGRKRGQWSVSGGKQGMLVVMKFYQASWF